MCFAHLTGIVWCPKPTQHFNQLEMRSKSSSKAYCKFVITKQDAAVNYAFTLLRSSSSSSSSLFPFINQVDYSLCLTKYSWTQTKVPVNTLRKKSQSFKSRVLGIKALLYCDSCNAVWHVGWMVGPSNHVLDEGPDPFRGRGNFEVGKGHPIVKYRNNGPCTPKSCLLYTSDAADE